MARPKGVFSTINCLIDAPNKEGSTMECCGTNTIEPSSGPRKRSLKTRMLKNEFAATANCKRSSFPLPILIPFNRFTSRSIVTVPFSTIIFCKMPVGASEFFCLDCAA